MRNCTREAYEFLEEHSPGGYGRVIEFVLERDGVLHAAADCFLAGFPCADAPGTLYVVFQCSHLPALRRVLLSMPQYTRVRWRRDFKQGTKYGERERAIADFCRHEDFGTGLTKQSL